MHQRYEGTVRLLLQETLKCDIIGNSGPTKVKVITFISDISFV